MRPTNSGSEPIPIARSGVKACCRGGRAGVLSDSRFRTLSGSPDYIVPWELSGVILVRSLPAEAVVAVVDFKEIMKGLFGRGKIPFSSVIDGLLHTLADLRQGASCVRPGSGVSSGCPSEGEKRADDFPSGGTGVVDSMEFAELTVVFRTRISELASRRSVGPPVAGEPLSREALEVVLERIDGDGMATVRVSFRERRTSAG